MGTEHTQDISPLDFLMERAYGLEVMERDGKEHEIKGNGTEL